MNNKEYANYDYQTTTIPFKTEYGVTIGKETKNSFKLCTKDCVYKDNWNKLKEWLEEESKLKGSETAYLYYGRTLNKMQEIEGGMND